MLKTIRKQFVNAQSAEPVNLQGRHILVTGCALHSLGYTTALELLRWGAKVTVTSRSSLDNITASLKAKLPAEQHTNVSAQILDLADSESTKAFTEWYIKEQRSLDVLINNAGIHLDLMSKWKSPKLSPDGEEIQWRTNYLGTLHLTQLLLPLLLESADTTGDARIVNVVSMLHSKGANSEFFNPSRPYNSWHAYGQSKLGLIHFTNELQRRYSQQGLTAYSLHPGAVYTNVASKGLEGHKMIGVIRDIFAPFERFFMLTPIEGAQTSLLCATSKDAVGGKYYRNCRIATPSTDVGDSDIAKALWEKYVKLT